MRPSRSPSTSTPRRNRAARIGRSIAALMLMAIAGGIGTYSAFSDFSASEDNAFESGRLSITRDGGEGTALFDVKEMIAGKTEQRCITITNDGTIDYDALAVQQTAANGELGQFLTMQVSSADPVNTDGGSCDAFNALSSSKVTDIADMSGTANLSHTTDEPPIPVGESRSYQIIARLADVQEAQSKSARDITFRWSAQQGD